MGRVPKLFENFAVNLGDKIKLNITSLGKSEKAMAVQVSGVKTSNKFTHITLAISPEGRAVDSNFISKWEEEKNDLVLNGEVVEYTVDDLVNLDKQKKKTEKPQFEKKLTLGYIKDFYWKWWGKIRKNKTKECNGGRQRIFEQK